MIGKINFRNFLKSKLFTLLIIWIGLLVIFTVWAGIIGVPFLTVDTIVEIGDLLVLTSFLSVGAGFLMVSGNLDLSASAIGMCASVFMAKAMRYWEFHPMLAILGAIVVAVLLGTFNGMLVNEFKFPPFIATLAMAGVITGLAQWISVPPGRVAPGPVQVRNDYTRLLGDGKLFDLIPYTLILAVIVFVVYGLVLARTKFGKQVYMVGGNPQAARLSGISPRKMYYLLFANSGFLAGIAGVIHMGRNSQGSLNALAANQFTGLTAALLGGISFGGGSGNLAGVFLGLVVLNTFNKGTTIVRFSTYWTTAFTGILLLIALTMDHFNLVRAQKQVGLIKPAKEEKH